MPWDSLHPSPCPTPIPAGTGLWGQWVGVGSQGPLALTAPGLTDGLRRGGDRSPSGAERRDQVKWKAGGRDPLLSTVLELRVVNPFLHTHFYHNRGALENEGEPLPICLGLEGCGEADKHSRRPGVKEWGEALLPRPSQSPCCTLLSAPHIWEEGDTLTNPHGPPSLLVTPTAPLQGREASLRNLNLFAPIQISLLGWGEGGGCYSPAFPVLSNSWCR